MQKSSNKSYAARIKEARAKLSISQSQAAKEWGFGVQTIQAWEHGRNEPRGLYREKIEKILSRLEQEKD